jgi:hypothetical protein
MTMGSPLKDQQHLKRNMYGLHRQQKLLKISIQFVFVTVAQRPMLTRKEEECNTVIKATYL